jgi:hypothetical protein
MDVSFTRMRDSASREWDTVLPKRPIGDETKLSVEIPGCGQTVEYTAKKVS